MPSTTRSAIGMAAAVTTALVVLAVGSVQQAAGAPADPKPPVFPDTYVVRYTFSMPHLYLTQPKGLSYPIQVWYDGPNNRRRVEVMDGQDVTLNLQGVEYTLYPRLTKYDCDVYAPGPTATLLREAKAPPAMPDLKDWRYGGTVTMDGKDVQVWTDKFKEGERVSQYSFFLTPAGVPVRLSMIGINFISGAHYDEYVYDFTHFEPGLGNAKPADLFTIPELCKAKVEAAARGGGADSASTWPGQHPVAAQHEALLPLPRSRDHSHAYHMWCRVHGRVHDDASDFAARFDRFKQVVDMVAAHGAEGGAVHEEGQLVQGFTMRVNQWADWSHEEFFQAMMPMRMPMHTAVSDADRQALAAQRTARKQAVRDRFKPKFKFSSKRSKKELPKSVDWRGTGADPGVKDQAACGSCFAFAATGSMDGAWYVSTGQARSFSEQQVVDCGWGYVNGCNGGDFEPVYYYAIEHGGMALEQEYPYEGEMGWCRADNHTRVGMFDGYIEVEAGDEESLMDAVYTFGPIAVAVDASPDSFRYYAEGVWTDPACTTKARLLDHAVVVFGYGTTERGEDYWLVRNSWAKFYGEDGYVKIARGAGDCGISSEPVAASVAKEFVVEGARALAQAAATDAN